MKIMIGCLFTCLFFSCSVPKNYYMLTGTYTGSGSRGIYVHDFNTKNGASFPVDSIQASNPSFLVLSPDGKNLYAVNENTDVEGVWATVSSFSFNRETGALTKLGTRSSQGNHPCYITIDKTGKWVIAGNYSSGNFASFRVGANGNLDSARQTIEHVGHGPDKRQEGPHVHSTVFSPDNRFLFVADLGTDMINSYRFNDSTGRIEPTEQQFVQLDPGKGPRHFVFHPNHRFAYLLSELTGTVDVFAYNPADGSLNPVQSVSSVPEGFTGFAGSADIHLSADGKFLYASNRGDANNIAIFKTDQNEGTLTPVAHQPVLGKAPRHFSIDPGGQYLLCANQNSNEIVVFKRNKQNGLLTDTGKRIAIPKPVCIQWVKRS